MSFSPINFPPAFAGRPFTFEPAFAADEFFARLSHVLREQGLNPAEMISALVMPEGPARSIIDMLILRHMGQPAWHCVSPEGDVDFTALDGLIASGKARLVLNFTGLTPSGPGEDTEPTGPLASLLEQYLSAYRRAGKGVILLDRDDQLLLRIDNALLEETSDISLDLGFMLLRDRHNFPHEVEQGPTWRCFRSSREFAQSIREQGFGSADGEPIGGRLAGSLIRFTQSPSTPLDQLLQAFWPEIVSHTHPGLLAAQRLAQLQFAQISSFLNEANNTAPTASVLCGGIHRPTLNGAGKVCPWALDIVGTDTKQLETNGQTHWLDRLAQHPRSNPNALDLMRLIQAED